MEWLFALTVAAGVISAVRMYTFLRQRLPERRYRRQARQLAEYLEREQQDFNLGGLTAPPPESENFLAACYYILDKEE